MDESALADDGVCSITLTNPVRYFNDILFNSYVTPQTDNCDDDNDNGDVDGMVGLFDALNNGHVLNTVIHCVSKKSM